MRYKKARFAALLKKGGFYAAVTIAVTSLITGSYFIFVAHSKLGNFGYALSLIIALPLIWYKTELSKLTSRPNDTSIDGTLDAELLAKLKSPVSPKSAWKAMTGHWQEVFITNRLLLDPKMVEDLLSDDENDMPQVWQLSRKLQAAHSPDTLSVGAVCTALILSSPQILQHLSAQYIRPDDIFQIYDWLSRLLEYRQRPKPYFGGIGRDWAFGFTPNLERFSNNISQQIEKGGGHFNFLARSNSIDAMIGGLDQSGGIAVVGAKGIGKTSAVYALAERILQDKNLSSNIDDHQIVELNASTILSATKTDLERLLLSLFNEAIRSGNMIIFLDEAQLFFQEGVGSFDLSQILLPVLQNRRLKIICAFNTNDWQRLKMSKTSLTTSLTPIVLPEPTEQNTLKILEDSALTIEYRTKSVISYEAVRESYRLSGQYIQEVAYPGKAIHLLEQSVMNAKNNVVLATSVQETIESTLGVKVGGAQTQEADVLLNLEDRIHERMVNQSRAVSVVANALRRARAGVTSTKRPIGSFLFLGPTGVGKTELGKSLADVYFGDEKNMIRLDMSEYQQPEDINRILATGENTEGLLLAIRRQPFSVVLLDEIEKAHSSVLNLLLQLLDEGQLTDLSGQVASFKNAIIIVTSNAGAHDILERINTNQTLDDFERPLIDKLIGEGVFRPELVNRFDETVLFRPLTQEELGQVALLMLAEVNKNLEHQNISVELTKPALDYLVEQGYDPQFGSRPMRRVIQRTVEDIVANRILTGQAVPGATITLDLPDITTQ